MGRKSMYYGRGISVFSLVALAICLAFLSVFMLLTVSVSADEWVITCVDCPKLFAPMTDRSLAIDEEGHSHIGYGGDHLYYAYHDGSVWHYENVDASAGVGADAAIALDSNGYPHACYYDDVNQGIKYAYKDTSGWHIEAVTSGIYVVQGTSCLAVDGSGNAYIAGWTWSVDFPTQNPLQPDCGGGSYDAFVAKLNASEITEANWDSATQCTGEPTPQSAASSENFTITGLMPGTTHYFARKAADEVPNWSGLSNVVSGDTTELIPPNYDIIFSSNRDGTWEIYGMKDDGSCQINLTNNSTFDADPAFSADGEKIIFSSERECSGIPKLYVMDSDGTNVALLPVGVSIAPDGSLFCEPDILRTAKFSPDGSKIVFRSSLVPGGPPTNEEIYVMNSDGTNLVNLSNNPANDRDPVFTPDGNKIVFVSDRDADREIYIMNSDGSNQTRLTFNLGDDDVPEVSPDGSKIVFTSERDGNYEVYSMNIDGTNALNLTNNPAADGDGAFSPDGSKIVLISDRDGNLEVYIMDSDGSNQTRLTNTQGSDLQPFFNPLWGPFADIYPPIANAGPDQTVTDTDGNGSEDVSLDGTGSNDPDGHIVSWVWTENGNQIATGETPTVTLPVGTHTITLTVTDDDGATDTDDVVIAVIAPSAHTVSTPNTPTGSSSGQVGESLPFSTSGSACSEGHSVQYRFDWGNGNYSNWSSSTSASYSYPTTGTYQVRAQARCASDTSVVSNWSGAKTVVIEVISENQPPIVRASDINGQLKDMYPDSVYTVTAKYFDPDGMADLKICYLQLKHPEKRLTMMWYQEDGHTNTYAGEEGENYLSNVNVTSTDISDGNGNEGYELTWSFQINDQWPEVENAIDFGVFASDDSDLISDWDYDDMNASFLSEPALKCVVELWPIWGPGSIGVVSEDEEFLIYVGGSTGDITEVCFLGDDSVNGNPDGNWIGPFGWNTDSVIGGWDASEKTKEWMFATAGDKEIWAEVRSTRGVLDQDYAYMAVEVPEVLPVVLVHGFQPFQGYEPAELWQGMAAILSASGLSVYVSNYGKRLRTLGDIHSYAATLADEIETIKILEGVEQVDIVAHSMGGLVARAYVESGDFADSGLTFNNDVRKLIMLGTPNHGILEAAIASFVGKSVSQMAPGSEFLDILNHGCADCDGQDKIHPGVKYVVFAGQACAHCSEVNISIMPPAPGVGMPMPVPIEVVTVCQQECYEDGENWQGNDYAGGLFSVTMSSASLDGAELHACIPADHTALREQSQISEAVRDVLLSRPVDDVIRISDVLMVACPVHITIIDQHGRRLTDTGVDEIPGASLTTDDETGVIAVYLDPNLKYQVYIEAYENGQFTLMEVLQTQNDEFMINLFDDVPVVTGAKAKLTVFPSETERLLEIDSDGDGTTDEEKEPIVIGEEEDVLPDEGSAVVVGPNPVSSEGCVFWLDLPQGVSQAKLMILNVTGRLVFETPLDTDASRFPIAGTWTPVDQDSIPLANGPYVYVLIADGKVIGQGKMVIQR